MKSPQVIALELTPQQVRRLMFNVDESRTFHDKIKKMGMVIPVTELNPDKGQAIYHIHTLNGEDFNPLQLVFFGLFIGLLIT